MASVGEQVAIIGGGVVGVAVAWELARRGHRPLLLEAERRLGLGASAANSGILHTGFDSTPGELETRLILRSAELRGGNGSDDQARGDSSNGDDQDGSGGGGGTVLGVPLRRCGARLRAVGSEQQGAVRALAANAKLNGVEVRVERPEELVVPGESITDPLALLLALADAAQEAGAELRLGARVERVRARAGGGAGAAIELASGERLEVGSAINCAGLNADALDRGGPEIYPRKGEFLVFEQPAGAELQEILLPLPSSAGKGVLVFPTVDGHVIAGPTARDRLDKDDWSVEPDAGELILPLAREMFPPLADVEPIASYAGLRPAGRGRNYSIGYSESVPAVLNVMAIRSTGLSAAAAIGEHVAALLYPARDGGPPPAGPWPILPPRTVSVPWWRLAAERSHGPGWTATGDRPRRAEDGSS
jgi:glycerol-3-phosphate dehydrogenase